MAATSWTTADPVPRPVGDSKEVQLGGDTAEVGGIRLTVPAAVADEPVTVQAGAEIGQYGDEVFGRPVHVSHSGPLAKAITVSWPTDGMTDEQVRSAQVVHYNEELKVWETTTTPLRIEEDRLVADISDFSWTDIVAAVGQTAGELIGARVDAPKCSGKALPDWVEGIVDPDEETT
ncbi:MAG: hypothetical protein Q7T71_04100, partial [Herbiconiux sp.]|nr:hypothetical protein [Herbiconiux sp.]